MVVVVVVVVAAVVTPTEEAVDILVVLVEVGMKDVIVEAMVEVSSMRFYPCMFRQGKAKEEEEWKKGVFIHNNRHCDLHTGSYFNRHQQRHGTFKT